MTEYCCPFIKEKVEKGVIIMKYSDSGIPEYYMDNDEIFHCPFCGDDL